MAVIEFSNALRNRSANRAPLDTFGAAPAFNPTQNALRRLISPVPQSGLFSQSNYLRGLPTLGGSRASSSGGAPNSIVPGPLGVWEEDKGRPRQQTGKFGTNLLGSGQSFAPGAPNPYQPNPPDRAQQLRALGRPDNPENDGFLEGLFGAVGGAVGGLFGQAEGGQSVGRFIGSGADLPFEAAGNIAGLPLGLASGALFQSGPIDDDIRAVYDEASKDNPIQGLLLWSHMQKAQWQREHDAGMHTGLLGSVGPATALTDQVGLLMQAVFGGGAGAVQRVITSGGNFDNSIRAVEDAVRRGATVEQDPESGEWVSSDQRVKANVYANLQMRLARGDFGEVGSEQARDAMRDEIIAQGSILRDVSDVPQRAGEGANAALPFGMTFQGLADMAVQAITDPTIIASFGIGAVAKGAQIGMTTANAKFFTAVPQAARGRVTELIEQTAMKAGGFDSPERAWIALGRAQRSLGSRVRTPSPDDVAFESRVLREVAEHPDMAPYRAELRSSLDYLGRWHDTWEPALRPVVELVRTLNDPQRLFGAGKVSKAMGDVFSAHATEGVIRGTGSLNAHAAIQRTLSALPGDFLTAYNRGIAVSSAFASRAYHRNSLMSDLRRRLAKEDPTVHSMFQQYLPDEVVYSRMGASTARDIATGLEQQAIRVRPSYVDQGGEQGLARAREEAANRLRLMGVGPTEASGIAGRMSRDEIALIDRSYFGYAMDQFVTAREAAKAAGPVKGLMGTDEMDTLTMLGPNQMTMQRAQDVIEAVNRGDIGEVRAALAQYDILYENLGTKLDDAKLMRAVRELLEDQVNAKALPRDLDTLDGLPEALKVWATHNAEFGYRPGYRPPEDQLWRMTKDADGNVLGVNPWMEVASEASDVPTYTRSQLARDNLFHAIRGERIMADARVRMAEYTTGRWGISRGESDALFARFIKMASETGVTPRGMAPEQVYNIVMTQGLPSEVANRIGPREAIEALLWAFEGKFSHVGVTQKFTGSVKTGLGSQGNWIGRIAEGIYPVVRFTLNPVFQAQELTESFILNLMRGIRPGMTASELDTQTLNLIETILRDSRYAYDDQIEYGGTLLWGADAAHNAFGPESKVGRLTRKLSLGDRINVKEIKRVNYARATRDILGRAFREDMGRVAPDMLPKLVAHYGTDDWGRIAVKYMTEKGMVGETPVDILKPSYLGAREPVRLDKVARHFDGVANADELRIAVRAGRWDEAGFRDVLVEAGADEDFATRAWITAAAEFTPEEWWDAYRINFKAGNARATSADRALVKAVAEVHNMSEAEYLAKHMADVPHSVDERALMALADTEKRWYQFMEEIVDGGVHGRTQAANEAVERFRLANAHVADREHFAIIDDDGTVKASGQQLRQWKQHPSGLVTDAGLGDEVNRFLPLLWQRTLVHNHPSHNPFSAADMITGAEFNAKEMIVTSPGITYSLRPASDADGGWFTDEFATFTEGMDIADVRKTVEAIWQAEAGRFIQDIRQSPWYARRLGDRWDAYLDAISTNYAVQQIADRFGWKFDSVTDFRLPVDDAVRHEQLSRMAAHSIPSLRQQYPYTYGSEPLARIEARAGTSVAYEYDTDLLPWLPRNLSDEQQRLVQDYMDDWHRSVVAPKFGVLVTDVRHGRGGWYDTGTGQFSDTINAVEDVFGTREQVRAYAAAIGHNSKQWAVFTSRPKIGANVADYSAGEAWSWQYIATRALSDDEAVELQRAIAKASPEVAGWGSSIVRTADGRTAIRYVNGEMEGAVSREQFVESTRAIAVNDAINEIVEGLDYNIAATADVMDFDRLYNNWDEAPNGETYRGIVGEHRPDVAGELGGGLALEARDRLAHALRTFAPDEFNAHLATLDPGTVPDFRVPGEFDPAPLASRLSISIPGGRESLTGSRALNLWEQQVIKAQTIDASALYNADPDLYVRLMNAIWRGKWKELEAGMPNDAYNAFLFASLTGNSALDVTEGAYALMRASMEPGLTGVRRMQTRAQRIINKLPAQYQRNPSYVGTMFQIDEGLRVSGYDLSKADWLTPEYRSTIDRFQSRFDEAMRAMPEGDREAFARAVQRRLDGGPRKGRASTKRRAGPEFDTSFVDDIVDIVGINRRAGVSVQVHPFPTKTIYHLPEQSGGPTVGLSTFISIGRPRVRFKGTATNTQWGRALKWLNDGIFSSDNPAVQRFIRPQVGESREAYGLRMSSILPGIDVKTAMMAMQSAGPRALAHGALDTHIVRYIVQKAMKRGDLDTLLDNLSPAYAKHLREEMARGADDASTAFKSPEGDRIYLVPEGKFRGQPWSPAKEQAMRSRLHLIEDPEVRALYDDPEVLRMVSETGGKVNRWGGDYALLDDYFNTVLKAEEVDTLRAAGHAEAADAVERMSGGEWQWFKWDQIRSASQGTPLDPHVGITRGADLVPNRVGVELDRAIATQRMGTPYDPKEMLFQREGSMVLGANQIMEDSRRVLLATQNVDGRTGLHELAHVFEQHLDPSMRNAVIAEFRKATGSKRTTWSREVSEWWADSLLDYARAGHRPGNAALRPSFDYFRKTLNGIEATIKAQQEAKVLAKTKASAVRKATAKVERATPALRDAEKAVRAAQRAQQTANRELRRARAKGNLDVLEGRAQALRDDVVLLDQQVKDARAAIRVARSAARAADVRAQQATGTASAGGLRASAKRAAARIEASIAEAERLSDALVKAKAAATQASRKVAGARRRTPVDVIERTRDRARAATDRALAQQRAAEKAVRQARKELDEAKALSTKPARAKVRPIPLTDEMRQIWDDITTPSEVTPTTVGNGQPYDLQQEAVYQAAKHALSRTEEEAFRLHYYKRGRNFVERSINHPYFGLYPASYMWGKILPEMIRFLTRKPFGLDAPLGGLALSHNIYRGVMIQQQYDPEFRAKMVENTDLWHFVSMMTPSLPWEIPVNAPLWARRFAEANQTRQEKLEALTPEQRAMLTPEQMAEDYPVQSLEQMGRTGREMLNYAFGPAAAIEQVTTAIAGSAQLATDSVQNTVDSILRDGLGQPQPVEQPSLFGQPPAMMPAQGPGEIGP